MRNNPIFRYWTNGTTAIMSDMPPDGKWDEISLDEYIMIMGGLGDAAAAHIEDFAEQQRVRGDGLFSAGRDHPPPSYSVPLLGSGSSRGDSRTVSTSLLSDPKWSDDKLIHERRKSRVSYEVDGDPSRFDLIISLFLGVNSYDTSSSDLDKLQDIVDNIVYIANRDRQMTMVALMVMLSITHTSRPEEVKLVVVEGIGQIMEEVLFDQYIDSEVVDQIQHFASLLEVYRIYHEETDLEDGVYGNPNAASTHLIELAEKYWEIAHPNIEIIEEVDD